MNEDYIFLSNSLPYEEDNRPSHVLRKLVKLLPLGLVHSTKGDFLVDGESFQSIQNTFLRRKLEIPIDYEHQTLKDVQAPAAGWIKDFVLKDDGIYGAVDWTERAAQYLKNKEYRYISPVINIRKEDRKVMGLHSAALTNTPAIDAMDTIANSSKPGLEAVSSEEPNDGSGGTLAELAELLGLEPSATMEGIYKAVSALLEDRNAMELKADACQFEVVKLKADSIVTEALKEGKLMPWQRDMAFAQALSSLDSFTLWLKTAPQVVPMGEFNFGSLPSTPRLRSRVHELMGLSAEDIKKYGNI